MKDDSDPTDYNGDGCEACGQSYQGEQTECNNPTCFEEWQLGNELINRVVLS